MNWDDYRYFLAVSRYGTLKLASSHLKVDQATVGRRILALQEYLGAKLLEKRSNGYILTAAGSRILQNVEGVEQNMLTIQRLVFGEDELIEGVVKIALPGALANQCLIGNLGSLFHQYPKLQLHFLTGPDLVNLSRREADIALRLVRPKQKEIKTKKIGTLKLGLYGVKKFSGIRPQYDLGDVPFVGLFDSATSELELSFLNFLRIEPRYCLRSAAWSSVFSAVQAGIGVGILPTFIAKKDKSLFLIQEDKNESPIWLAVHPEVSKSGRVRATIDHIAKVLSSSE